MVNKKKKNNNSNNSSNSLAFGRRQKAQHLEGFESTTKRVFAPKACALPLRYIRSLFGNEI